MTAATIDLLVILPSHVEPDSGVHFAQAAVTPASPAPCAAVISLTCADPLASGEADWVPTPARPVEPNCAQSG